MNRRLTQLLSIVSATLTTASLSLAQPRPQGELALGADRLFGYAYTTFEYDGTDVEFTTSEISFLGARGNATNFNFPRLSLDYFVTDGVSIGGSLVYVSTTISDGDTDADSSGFGLAPRAGYATMFSPNFGIWPRGGITYISADQGDVDVSGVALTVEVPLVIAPSDNVAITFGPTLDYALSLSAESGGQDVDLNSMDFGLMAGLVGFI